MIRFPKTLEQALPLAGSPRAGGTDLVARRKAGTHEGDLVDLRDLRGELGGIEQVDGRWRVGAMATVAEIAAHEGLRRDHPALTSAAETVATPQLRRVGTLGGNLCQRPRCWYFRSPDFPCLKKHGGICFARIGDHAQHSCVDLGPCLAPHPSTLGMALLAFEAELEVDGAALVPASSFFGAEGDPTRENTLAEGSLVTAALLPEPWSGERGAAFRSIARAQAEWPAVEACVRVALAGQRSAGEEAAGAPAPELAPSGPARGPVRIREIGVAIGGVAVVPLRLPAVEDALRGKVPDPDLLAAAAAQARAIAKPPPGAAWKVELLAPTVLSALERALGMEER